MGLFGMAALFIGYQAISASEAIASDVAMIEILLIVVLAILAQTVVLIKIYEQHQ